MGTMDFSLTPGTLGALLVASTFPFYHWAIVRIPMLKGRNAVQFLASTVLALGLWALVVGLLPYSTAGRPRGLIPGLLLLGAACMVYLEIWSLLSRGFTLGLLLTLLDAGRPVDVATLARLYRGGEGISWVTRHRLEGLISLGLVRKDDNLVVLRRGPGHLVAYIYTGAIAALGLRKTG